MNNINDFYQARSKTPQEAAKLIQSNTHLFLTGNCSVPREVMSALTARAHELSNVEIYQVLTIGSADYVAKGMEKHLRVNTLFISDNVRSAVQEGRADFTPCFLSEIPDLFTSKRLPIDIALIQVSPPDEHGYCSLGVEVGVTKAAAQSAKFVIAEINSKMPRAHGDAFIHISKLDVIVPVDYYLPEVHMSGETNEVTENIASYVASLIPNGATLQTGIGAIPNAVLKRLTNHQDLGIHTELFSDGIIELVKQGVINGEKKSIHHGKIVAGFMLGTQALYEFAHDNPQIEMHPTEYVNDPFVISKNNKMVAINSAIEVDLTGQVCADSIGTRFYSGVGGQIDFIYGASRSKGGVPIIALPSKLVKKNMEPASLLTKKQEQAPAIQSFSKIVPMLKPGAGVTTSRNHVRYVITEHGIADLYGKTIRQRAEALINIADPEFRDELRVKARELNYL
ncbi:MAG: acetyl-CoA hydrolase/transferase [Chloroflexi bacterium OLB14]|nr:MAG: acetyl-CoA hydrolase/transferase [Chloroflexi bacterium OLB14]